MPRELITVSVGQAGNQIGHRFWELAVKEHAAFNTDGLFSESMSRWVGRHGTVLVWVGVGAERQLIIFSLVWARQPLPPARSFFRNVDGGADLPLSAPGKAGERKPLPINDLRARAVLVDMVGGCIVRLTGMAPCVFCAWNAAAECT